MLRSLKNLNEYTILAQDEPVGQVEGFYFDDQAWSIRYLVINLGVWLPGRKVLIAPIALGQPDWGGGVSFPVHLRKEQIENSPQIDMDKPISRQHETELHNHYGWSPYWLNVSPIEAAEAGMKPADYLEAMRTNAKQSAADAVMKKTIAAEQAGDPHLRSTNEVISYKIRAVDGEIGHVEDFVIDDEKWVIRYLVVDTRNWLSGKEVLVIPQQVEEINWAESQVRLNLTRDAVKDSPEYDPATPVNRGPENKYYDYMGRPKY